MPTQPTQPPQPQTGQFQYILDGLEAAGFIRAEVEFSGGNDSGQIEEINLTRADGTIESPEEIIIPQDAFCRAILEETGTAIGEPINLQEFLFAPIGEEYGSFAGDFSVCGTVRFDVKAKKVTMSRQEQQWTDMDDLEWPDTE